MDRSFRGDIRGNYLYIFPVVILPRLVYLTLLGLSCGGDEQTGAKTEPSSKRIWIGIS